MAKNLILSPILVYVPKIFIVLDIVASYHRMQFEGKPIIQTQEKDEKPHFGPDLGLLGRQNSFPKIWLCQSLDIMVSYHHVQYQKKLMIQF